MHAILMIWNFKGKRIGTFLFLFLFFFFKTKKKKLVIAAIVQR